MSLARVLPPECVVEEAAPALVDEELYPEELAHLAQSVPKRRAEFGTARVCARRALARLGIAPMALVPSPDRSPRWPEGVVGSITHTQGYCAVAVARSAQLQSLGVDAEVDKPLGQDIVEMICTPGERRTVQARDAVVYFAAKEAFYKCQYPLTRQFLDFQDVELELSLSARTFRVRILKPLPRAAAELSAVVGRFVREQGLVVCGMGLSVGGRR